MASVAGPTHRPGLRNSTPWHRRRGSRRGKSHGCCRFRDPSCEDIHTTQFHASATSTRFAGRRQHHGWPRGRATSRGYSRTQIVDRACTYPWQGNRWNRLTIHRVTRCSGSGPHVGRYVVHEAVWGPESRESSCVYVRTAWERSTHARRRDVPCVYQELRLVGFESSRIVWKNALRLGRRERRRLCYSTAWAVNAGFVGVMVNGMWRCVLLRRRIDGGWIRPRAVRTDDEDPRPAESRRPARC